MEAMTEKEFLAKLTGLKELGALQGGYITLEQLQESFPGLEDEKQQEIIAYLKKSNIGLEEPVDTDALLTTEENGYLHFYMEELEELEDVSEDKKRVLVMGALNHDKAAKEDLMRAYLKTVVDIAKLYVGQGANIADLIGEGNVALTLAVDMIECVETPEDADSLIVKMIMNGMEEFLEEEAKTEKTGEKASELLDKVTESAKNLSEELLRKVTVKELAQESGIPVKRIRDAMRISKECLEYIEKEEEE